MHSDGDFTIWAIAVLGRIQKWAHGRKRPAFQKFDHYKIRPGDSSVYASVLNPASGIDSIPF